MTAQRGAAGTSLWDHALRVVKGDSTVELVERFTQEMTLVAEGLCEDQARLRKAVDGLMQHTESERSRILQDMQHAEKQFDELGLRLSALEKNFESLRGRGTWRSLLTGDVLGRVALLVSIICATVLIVTVMKLFI